MLVPISMHHGWPWAILPLSIATTLSWPTCIAWFSTQKERALGHCVDADARQECGRGGPWAAPSDEQEPSSLFEDSGTDRNEETSQAGSRRRRHGNSSEAGAETDPEPRPPADHYDDIFYKIASLVGSLCGRAVAALLRWVWTFLDWFGLWVLGAWWIRLKWVSVLLIAAVFFSGVVVIAVVAFLTIKGAISACRWAWQILRLFSSGEVTAHDVRVAAGDPTVTTLSRRSSAPSTLQDPLRDAGTTGYRTTSSSRLTEASQG